jgi:hypothetical protein
MPVRRLVRWAARILAIAAILFISIFALDAFEAGKPWNEIAAALFVHLLPNLVPIAVLAVAWRIEWLGGILFIAVGLSPFVLLSNPKWVNLMLGAPFMLAGLLFLTSHYLHVREGSGGRSP